MTFLRYSIFTSSSDFAVDGVPGLEGTSWDARSDTDDLGERRSVELSCLEAQYPTPGFRCFSSRAADDWTLRNSSRNVWNENRYEYMSSTGGGNDKPCCEREVAPLGSCSLRYVAGDLLPSYSAL